MYVPFCLQVWTTYAKVGKIQLTYWQLDKSILYRWIPYFLKHELINTYSTVYKIVQSWAHRSLKSLIALERTLISGGKERLHKMSDERQAN